MRDAERIIDKVKIYVKAGDGGDGAVAFHREKYVSHGGPSGGDGGHGGNIVFRVDPGATTLLFFRDHRKFVAKNGENGKGEKFHGGNGTDVEILVPLGTLIRDAESGRTVWVDTGSRKVRENYTRAWDERHEATSRLLRRYRIDNIDIDTADNYVTQLIKLFKQR